MVVFKPSPSVSIVVQPESSEDAEAQPPTNPKIQRLWRKSVVLGLLRNILPGPSAASNNNFQRQLSDIDTSRQQRVEQSPQESSKYDLALDQTSRWVSAWNTVISFTCLYNLISIPLLAFDDIFNYYYWYWLAANLIADLLYLLDFGVQCFISYYSMGLLIRDIRRIGRHYYQKKRFVMDVISVLPTDLLLIKWNGLSVLRINRLAKCHRIFGHLSRTQMRSTRWSNVIVMSKVILPIVIIFHWNAAGYFALSVYYGIDDADRDGWAFSYEKIMDPLFSDCNWLPWDRDCEFDETPLNGTKKDYIELMEEYWMDKIVVLKFSKLTKKYVLSFYWSSMTITTLGEQPQPNDSLQNLYEITNTVIGILIFGAIMGSVAEIVQNANTYKRQLRAELDQAKIFMKNRMVEPDVQLRVSNYFDFAISTRQFFDDPTQADSLTTPLQKDIRKQMLLEKFRKVGLFNNMSTLFMEELITSVFLRLYAPGDYVCLKGDICREMFVIERGKLVELKNSKHPIRKLKQGDYFGELSMMYVPEHKFENRYSSSLLSLGFCEVFVLPVESFRRLLKDFPAEAKELDKITRSQLKRLKLLRTKEEMAQLRQPDPPALDLDDRLDQLRKTVQQIQEGIHVHSQRFEHDQIATNNRLQEIEDQIRRRQLTTSDTQKPTTSSNICE